MSSAVATNLDVRRLSGCIGAEIRGVDLKKPLSDDVVKDIRQQLLAYRVIFFPQQHLNPDQHVDFASYFGEVTPAHPIAPGIAENNKVFEIDYDNLRKSGYNSGERAERKAPNVDWHTDVTFVKTPPLGSILNAIDMPPHGGDTMWSNQVAAFEDLSESMKSFLRTLTGVHDGGPSFRETVAQTNREFVWEGEVYRDLVPTEHPAVRIHPETGEEVLFINGTFTSHFKELSLKESRNLLAFLHAHCTQEEYTVRYHWTTGDLGFWDNRATQHAVVGDYGDQPRKIRRVTIYDRF